MEDKGVSPLKIEPQVQPTVELTPREVALAELIARSLSNAFDSKLEAVRREMHGYVEQANATVKELSQQQAAFTEVKLREAQN